MEVIYLEKAETRKEENIRLMQDPLLAVSITCDLWTEKHSSVAFLGITQHIIIPCVEPHSNDTEMENCIYCKQIQTIKLGVIKFECLLKEIDYKENIIFNSTDKFDEEIDLLNDLKQYIVVPHSGDNIKLAIKNMLLSFGIDLKEFQQTIAKNVLLYDSDNEDLLELLGNNKNTNQNSNQSNNQSNCNVNERNQNINRNNANNECKSEDIESTRLLPLPMTSDCGTNIIKASRIGTDLLQLSCLSHNGSTGLKWAIKRAGVIYPIITTTLTHGKRVVRYQKRSHFAPTYENKLVNAPNPRFVAAHETIKSVYKEYNNISMYRFISFVFFCFFASFFFFLSRLFAFGFSTFFLLFFWSRLFLFCLIMIVFVILLIIMIVNNDNISNNIDD